MSEQIGPGPDNYGEGYLDKLDAKLKPRIDALQASEKNVFDNQFDAIRKTYAYLQSRLTAAETRLDWLLRECKIIHYIANEADEMAADYPVEHYASVGKLMIDRAYIDAELDKLKGTE